LLFIGIKITSFFMSATIIHSTVPVIGTDDIKKSIFYYAEVLGFARDFEFGDPISYAGVKSGDAEIYFNHDPVLHNVIRTMNIHPEVFIWVPDGAALYRMHAENGADIIEPISDRSWGARQYVVKEINGYHLKFAQAI
jgi:uncharacterized glyoxalase superfamily protein PhnB